MQYSPFQHDRIYAGIKARGCTFKRGATITNGYGWIRDGQYVAISAVDVFEILLSESTGKEMLKRSQTVSEPIERVSTTAQMFKQPEWVNDPEHIIWQVLIETIVRANEPAMDR